MARNRTIGVLSRETGVKVTTIRYYEKIRVLAEGERTPSGHRVYEHDAIERLNFIRHARELRFEMASIRELVSLQDCPEDECSFADEIARRHLLAVRSRIAQLQALAAELARISKSCAGGKIENCRVIQSLGAHAECDTDHSRPPLSEFGSPI